MCKKDEDGMICGDDGGHDCRAHVRVGVWCTSMVDGIVKNIASGIMGRSVRKGGGRRRVFTGVVDMAEKREDT